MRDRATIGPAGGLWAGSVDALNSLITDLVPFAEAPALFARLDRGDRVLVMRGKTPAWHYAMLGALKGGLVAVPCPDMLRAAGEQVYEIGVIAPIGDGAAVIVG